MATSNDTLLQLVRDIGELKGRVYALEARLSHAPATGSDETRDLAKFAGIIAKLQSGEEMSLPDILASLSEVS